MLQNEAIIYISSFTEQTTAIIQNTENGPSSGTLYQRKESKISYIMGDFIII